MNLRNMLNALKEQNSIPLTEEICQHIKTLKQICDENFYNQRFYGGAALNRQILLDARIADNLTPEVILYLFTNSPTEETMIVRNSIGHTSLRDAIYYGMLQGLQIIKYSPNNERDYNPEKYAEQINNFEKNTLRIVDSIKKASGIKEIQKENDIFKIELKNSFYLVVRTIDLLKSKDKSGKLLYVADYSSDDVRNQVGLGFDRLCRKLKIDDLTTETLDSFCEKFLSDPNVILNGEVIHLFYDRLHLEAALEQNTQIKIGDKEYTYKDIFEVMVDKVATQPERYPTCVKEQFYLRFSLVENHLNETFKDAIDEARLLRNEANTFAINPDKEINNEVINIVVNNTKDIVQVPAGNIQPIIENNGFFARSTHTIKNISTIDPIKMYCTYNQEIALEFTNAECAKQFADCFKGVQLSDKEVTNNSNKAQFKTNPKYNIVQYYNNKPNHVFFMTQITGNVRLAINFKSTEKRDEFIKLLGIKMNTEVHQTNGLISQSAYNDVFTIYNGKSITGASPNTSIYFHPGLFLDKESVSNYFIIEGEQLIEKKYHPNNVKQF